MGSGPSKEDVLDDTEFLRKVQADQESIMKNCVADISNFFSTIDDMVVKGSINEKAVDDLEKTNEAEMKRVGEATKATDPSATPPATAPKYENKVAVPHKSKADVLVILNQASVFYSQSSKSDPAILKALVDTIKNTIMEVLPGAGGAPKEGAPANGFQVPTSLTGALSTLFGKPVAVTAAVEGVSSVVKLLLSSMESNLTVSSSLLKKIQFVSPGLYCATYYSTSVFHFQSGGFNKKTITYSLNCGGVYLVTSAEFVKQVVSLSMYREISESFTKRLRQSEETLQEFVGALQDSAYFGHKFGFTDQEYSSLMISLKTNIMKSIVTDFWLSTKDESKKCRTDQWNDYVKDGDFSARISRVKSAYETAYDDLKKYYNDYVLNPPISQK